MNPKPETRSHTPLEGCVERRCWVVVLRYGVWDWGFGYLIQIGVLARNDYAPSDFKGLIRNLSHFIEMAPRLVIQTFPNVSI